MPQYMDHKQLVWESFEAGLRTDITLAQQDISSHCSGARGGALISKRGVIHVTLLRPTTTQSDLLA
jgi:hypothetical protein